LSGCCLLMSFVLCASGPRCPVRSSSAFPISGLIASTGLGNASIDVAAAGDHGIPVVHTGYRSDPTIEFTWALILASARHIVTESNSVRSGGWQQQWARISVERPLAFWDLGGLDHRSRGSGALLE